MTTVNDDRKSDAVADKIRKSLSSKLLRMSVTELNLELNETEMSLLKLTGDDSDTNNVHVGEESDIQVLESGSEYTREKEDDSFMQRYKLINRFAVRSVACGNRVTLLLTVQGTAFQFGTMLGSYCPPKRVIIDEEDGNVQREIVQIAVSAPSIESHGDPNDHCACIINENGKNLYTWGSNDYGQLGLSNTASQEIPQVVRGISERVSFVGCGSKFTIAITDTNQVYSFGLNSKGQLGLSSYTQRVRKETEVQGVDRIYHTIWNSVMVDKTSPTLITEFSNGRANYEARDKAFGPWIYLKPDTIGNPEDAEATSTDTSKILNRVCMCGRGFSISWVRAKPCSQAEKDRYIASLSMFRVIREIQEVLEDKMLELKLLKPPDDQTTNNKEGLNISRNIDTMQDAVLTSIVGVPRKDNVEVYHQIRKDSTILEVVNVIYKLEESSLVENRKIKNVKTKLQQFESRIENLASRMMENGENSSILWTLLEEMPTHISKFGESRVIHDVRRNLKQLCNDRSALLKGNVQELQRQRMEMSSLVQNYNIIQKDEATIYRQIKTLSNQIQILTTLGRSYAQAIAKNYSSSLLMGPFDVCKKMRQFNSTLGKIEKNLVASEMKKTNLMQWKKHMHNNVAQWKCRPDSISGIENNVSKSHGRKTTLQHRSTSLPDDVFSSKTFSSSLELAELCESLIIDTIDVENDIVDLSLAIVDQTKRQIQSVYG
eukprot:g8470.t1